MEDMIFPMGSVPVSVAAKVYDSTQKDVFTTCTSLS